MTNHEIDELRSIPKTDIQQLPDRSNLSKLYFNTNKGYQKGSVNFENISNESSHTQYTKKLNLLFIPIGFIIPIPFAVAIIIFSYFSGIINDGNIMFLLPLVALSGIILAGATVLMYKKIRDMLDELGITFSHFLIYMLFCLSLIYVPISLACFHITNSILYHVIAYGSTAVIASAISWSFLKGTGDERIVGWVRLLMVIIPALICLGVAIAFNSAFSIQ